MTINELQSVLASLQAKGYGNAKVQVLDANTGESDFGIVYADDILLFDNTMGEGELTVCEEE